MYNETILLDNIWCPFKIKFIVKINPFGRGENWVLPRSHTEFDHDHWDIGSPNSIWCCVIGGYFNSCFIILTQEMRDSLYSKLESLLYTSAHPFFLFARKIFLFAHSVQLHLRMKTESNRYVIIESPWKFWASKRLKEERADRRIDDTRNWRGLYLHLIFLPSLQRILPMYAVSTETVRVVLFCLIIHTVKYFREKSLTDM